jgi:hypothetical protein
MGLKVTIGYLASPYRQYPHGPDAAYEEAAYATAWLAKRGFVVFSPIVHSHPLVKTGVMLPQFDHEFWMAIDRPFMDACDYLVFYKLEGWEKSEGMAEELRVFREAGKVKFDLDPVDVVRHNGYNPV